MRDSLGICIVLPRAQSARHGWASGKGSAQQQVPFGNDRPEKQRRQQIPFRNDRPEKQRQQQIPCGNDRQKCRCNGKCWKQIPFGNDRPEKQRRQQVPFGNDRQNGKGKGNSRFPSAALRAALRVCCAWLRRTNRRRQETKSSTAKLAWRVFKKD